MTSTLSPLTQAVTGAVGSASANALAYPLDLVTTRLQTTRSRKLQGIRGALAVLRYTISRHGVDALYDGLASDTASTLISRRVSLLCEPLFRPTYRNSFLYFYAYSFLRNLVLRRAARLNGHLKRSPVLPVGQELGLGFFAGVSSRLVTAPLSIVTVRLQTAREESEDIQEDNRIFKPLDAMKAIYAENGILGFWKGLEGMILLSFNPALTFAFLHFLRRLMQFRPRNAAKAAKVIPLGPLESFITGALANALAVSILYPLILAKTRLQAARMSPSLPATENDISSPESTSRRPPTMLSTLEEAYAGIGSYPSGLYQGLSAQIAKGFVSMGVTIMVKERIEHALVRAVCQWKDGT
ncbi:mitochondrial carrier domain-containing protein [Vararia minispora EC-137]|uniref:Mitochondrial carrier domain-containing protein n=1 Tax=Vararia minispora EC-137 TaxID=1314806 RepID=A0ACB8QVB4_9AGAM|nr:mitochondrial carrier domain-containing protein [Vararia minispora EC-137]